MLGRFFHTKTDYDSMTFYNGLEINDI